MAKRQSAARRLLELVYKHNREGTGWSWERKNHSLADALILALNCGFRFAADDFSQIYTDLKGSYWFGTDNDHAQGERFYRIAVETGNISACQSFEKWKNRPPFILQGRRLHHGSIFEWEKQTVALTSFSDDGTYCTACVYSQRPSIHNGTTYYHGKVTRRFKIDLISLRAVENEKRKAAKAAKAPKETGLSA